MTEEVFEIFNEKNELTGTAPREEVHSKGLFHRGVNVFVVNSKGEVFLEKRSKKKDTLPEYWDFVGEHLKPGETFEQAAVRGLKEELRLKAKVEMIRGVKFFHFEYPNGKIDREFDCLFIARVRDGIQFKLDPEEVEEGGFFAIDWIEMEIKSGERKFGYFFLTEWPELKNYMEAVIFAGKA